MSTLTEFLISHQATLGIAYTPVMTLYLLAMISPIWSAYLLICSAISLAPRERYAWMQNSCLYLRLSIDAIMNPSSLVIYYYAIPYLLGKSAYFSYFFFTNQLGDLSIIASSYFSSVFLGYYLWYAMNTKIFKKIKPGIDFDKEYLMGFYSPSRIFGAAAVLVALFDFEPNISYLLWCNIYIGTVIACTSYAYSVYYASKTAKFLLTNR